MSAAMYSTIATASLAAVAAVYAWQQRSSRIASASSQPTRFNVLSWNILARPFTYFNKEPPGCVQGHHNPSADIESTAQTRARYGLVSDALLARRPDVVLLQECEKAFFEAELNPRAAEVNSAYELFATHEEGPGTAVLVLRGGQCVATGVVTRVGATEDTGGTSKSVTLVQVAIGGRLLWLGSIHATPVKYGPQKVREQLVQLSDALRSDANATLTASPPRVLIAGDLNAEPDEVEGLQRSSCLGGLQRIDAGLGHTGLSSTFDEPVTIDHAFISPGLRVISAAREKQPASPFDRAAEGPSPVIGASDHVWQAYVLEME